MDRRTFISLGAAVSVGSGCWRRSDTGETGETGLAGSPWRDPEPAEWEPEGELDLVSFRWGIQTGDARPDAVELSIRSDEPNLRVVVARAEGGDWVVDRELELPCEHRARTTLEGLSPDTAYRVVAYIASGRSEVARFRTALAEGQGDRKLVFGATSCIGRSNAPWPNLLQIPAHELDFLILLGDTVYADEAFSLEEYRAYYDEAFSTEGLYEALRDNSAVATWDDHEVDNNWFPASVPELQLDAAGQAFREALPQTEGPSGGIWRKLTWGSVAELFVLDCRGERVPDEGLYVSEEQLSWLIEELKASTATFKLVLNSVPITDISDIVGQAEADDRWSGFEEQRTRLLSAIDEAGIEGVVWLAGDLHFSAVTWVGRQGDPGASQPEIFCGPSGSRRNPIGALYQGDRTQFPVMFSEWNWVLFVADPLLGTLQAQFIGDDGSVLEEITLAP